MTSVQCFTCFNFSMVLCDSTFFLQHLRELSFLAVFFQRISCFLWLSRKNKYVLCILLATVCSLLVLEDSQGFWKMTTERLGFSCDEISTLIITLGVTDLNGYVQLSTNTIVDSRCEKEIYRPIGRLELLFQSRLRFVSCVFECPGGQHFSI